jgi:DNA polymerase elongation subunit (family B)
MKFLGDIDTKDVILLDVKYVKSKEKIKDCAMFLFKNVKTDKKFVLNVENPKMEIFFVKPEYRNFDYNQTAIEKDKCYSRKVSFKNITAVIAKEAGGEWLEYYKQCKETGNYRSLANLFHYNYSFGADLDICDYYRCMWNIYYYNPETKVHLNKAFLDIENDVVDFSGMPEKGEAPINAVSVCDTRSMTVHTFCLRHSSRQNPLIDEFEESLDRFNKLCHETYDEEFPGFEYIIHMYDEELELIYDLFRVLKELDPDMLGIWNMGYDVPNIIARTIALGGDPIELFCDDEFQLHKLRYWEDKHAKKPVLKKDYFDVTSKIIWTDAMLNYGKLRKNRAQLRSTKLDYISKIELGSGKFNYSGSYDKNLPYTNYENFILYSIKDVLLLYGIEKKTEDMDDVFSRATLNGSMYKSVFSQTRFLKNRFYIECYKDGFIAGNNANMDYSNSFRGGIDDDDEVKFDGAVVGDPELNDHVGETIFGLQSKYVFKYVIDMDFSSMYPWTIISFNISAKTLIGKLIINNEYYHGNAKDMYEEDPSLKFEAGKEFFENYITKDLIRLGVNWFNLPSVDEMISDLEELYPSKEEMVITIGE